MEGAGAGKPFLIVGVDGEKFGLEAARLETVIEHRAVEPIPGRPGAFIGALNHHGELLPVVPLAALLGRPVRLEPGRAAIAILGWEDAVVGLAVERTFGLLVPGDLSREARVLGNWEGPHLDWTADVDGERFHLLDTDSLLAELGRSLSEPTP